MLDIKLKLDKIVSAIEDKKGMDIKVYPMEGKTPFYDYSILCTGSSKRNISAIVDAVKDNLDVVKSVEGLEDSEWVLIDGEDIIVNIFTKEAREYYELDGFYGEI
ncbi:ribosome silencing factor [Sneathia sanguinegens]|uniref:Ribosomal silencing factor RsfS n=1 Tax=Sneathia sanguinegens TaxID=40543 RepID=A0ABT7HI51_9FUSO|nr:ribosome silencing factor [Sneathia sanguinegens]MDK9580192.1 ribosome silencing factor [Sneathia sanguinegens]